MLVHQRGCVKTAHCLHFPASLGQLDNTLIVNIHSARCSQLFTARGLVICLQPLIFRRRYFTNTTHDARGQQILNVFQKSYQRCIFTLQQKSNKEIINVTTQRFLAFCAYRFRLFFFKNVGENILMTTIETCGNSVFA